VYVGTRKPITHPDGRVVPLILDVTKADDIQRAVAQVDAVDILINNAGLAMYDDLSDPSVLEQHLAVNLFGPYRMIQAFLPWLIHSGGAVVNNLSVNALAPLPVIPAYSVSKAAAFNLTQSLRGPVGGSRRASSCRTDRAGGYRHDPWPRHTKGCTGIRCARDFRRSGEGPRRNLPR